MDTVTRIKDTIHRFVDMVGEGKISIAEIFLEPKFTLNSLQTEWILETYVIFLTVHAKKDAPKVSLTKSIEDYLGWETIVDSILKD